MALDPVPFVIGGDAEHGPSVFRQLAYLATNGNEGVVGPGDLKVTALSVPGAGVQVAAGGASILNRVSSQEAYTARNPNADTTSVKIAATGSSGGRSYLVILRVDNPYIDGNAQAPADPVKGPYDRFDVIAGVPASTTRLQDIAQYAGVSAITLARVDLPASTGTVTNAMITDLRVLANPHETTIETPNFGTVSGTMNSTSDQAFPPFQPSIEVPSWATYARVGLTISQLSAAGNSNGFATMSVRDSTGTTVIGSADTMAYNVDTAGTSVRFVHLASAFVRVDGYRGKTIKPYSHFRKGSSNQNALTYDQYSQMVYRTTFYERIV
ncbi:hypothetical protein DEI99_005320 [Curtobacterium sp. MCLR17_036]|uniref:hypothetical protein n=1 Tax=Curtobacterium sp. MCLR17_036 TaxID=2175620 RepID=UPI0011B7F0B3|nr:hypothetical protein [Curtobacterium sp. MCLR17_036]WIE65959.1 hypothetical protein DEI99_005320 [Curtobacterium sp. MCLR17_036]